MISRVAIRATRAVHSSPILFKKKAAKLHDFDTLFAEPEEEKPVIPTPPPTTTKSTTRLSEADRDALFDKNFDFITPRLGRNPQLKTPQVRTTIWSQLVQLARSEQQLQKIVDLLPQWNESGRVFNHSFSELFVRRCEELKCPTLALKVYSDYAKYQLPLSLPAARQLLHSLHTEHPIEAVMTASALYDVHNLPSVSEDLVSAALVTTACLKNDSVHSKKVANTLVSQIKELLKKQEPVKEGRRPRPRAFDEKSSLWLKWSLKKIDKALFLQTGKRDLDLKSWRVGSGYIKPNEI